MEDILTRGISEKGHINALACRTTNLVNEARRLHDLWPVASAALGRTMNASLMMAAQLKDDDAKVEVQIDGDGDLGKIVVDAYPNGTVRGYVNNPFVNYELKEGGGLNVGKAVGSNGTLRVFKDLHLKEPFVGTVELQNGEIGDDFAYYFAVSEQIPSAIGLGVLVDTDNSIISSGGFLVQVMPEASEEEISELEKRLKNIKSVTSLLKDGLEPIDMIKLLVPDYKEIETLPLKWNCKCSYERSETILSTLRMKELKEIIDEDKKADLHCEFCGKTYHFSEDDLKRIYDRRIKEIANKIENSNGII